MLFLVDDTADYRFLVEHVFKLFLAQYPLRLFSDGLELIQYVEQTSVLSPAGSTRFNSGPHFSGLAKPDLTRPDLTRPGLIVLDIDMPQLNGLQTLERLKQNALWRSVPVAMMSNRIEADFMETAYKLGANAFIPKPMDLHGLKGTMEQLCKQWLDE